MSSDLIKSVQGLSGETFNLFGLYQFGFSFDIQSSLESTASGHLLYVDDFVDLFLHEDGRISFSLTDANGVSVSMSTPVVLDDDAQHNVEVNYDSNAGVMSFTVDGEVVAQTDAAGITKTEDAIDAQAQTPELADMSDIQISNPDSISGSTFNSDDTSSDNASSDTAVAEASAEVEAPADADNVIYVNNSEELFDAVLSATGGEQILLVNNGEPYGLSLQSHLYKDYETKLADVKITSADPDDLVTFDNIFLKNVEHLHFDNLNVFSGDKYTDVGWRGDIYITQTDSMSFTNLNMSSIAEGVRGLDEFVVEGNNAISVYHSTNFEFSDNSLSHYANGLDLHESTGSVVSGNEITRMQGDGIRMSGVVDTVVEDNYIHNFIGSTHDVHHMDMIQVWAVNETRAVENLVVRNNILDAEDGWPTQTIFMRNEDVDRGVTDLFFKDITIENNLIHNVAYHGIFVGQVDGLKIANNTMLYNEKANIEAGAEDSRPNIRVHEDALNVDIVNNIAPSIHAPDDANMDNNVLVDYQQPDSDYYIDNLFVNAQYGGDIGIEGLQALPGGLIETMGAGSSFTVFNATPDNLTALYTTEVADGHEEILRFDASLTADANGFVGAEDADFIWDFGDGTTATGLVVEHEFADYAKQEVTLTVVHRTTGETDEIVSYPNTNDPLLLDVDFEDGKVEDASSYETAFDEDVSSENIVDGAYHVSVDTPLTLERGADQMFDLDQFSFSFDMKRTLAEGDHGHILYLHTAMGLVLNEDGSLTFNFEDNQGVDASMTTEALITDGEWHHVDLSYDTIAGSMEIYVDGELAAQGDTVGLTQSEEYWSLMFGSYSWRDSADFYVDNIEMTADPIDLGGIPDEESFMPDQPDVNSFETIYEGTEGSDINPPKTNGDDYYDLKGGDDSIRAGEGDDWIQGGDGNDDLYGEGGYDTIFGGAGDDFIRGELAFGEDGNDTLDTSDAGGHLFGGAGDDSLAGRDGNDYLDGGDGVDYIKGFGGDDTLVVDRLDEWVQGGDGFDTVLLDDTGTYDIGEGGFFHSIEAIDMTNGDDNVLAINWGDIRSSQDGAMFVHGDDGDSVTLDATYANMQDKFTTEEVEIDGQSYTHYSADNDRWLDVDLYVANNVDVDIIM